MIGLANQVENMVTEFDDLDVKVAVMGCVVNGPGEAREADIGIAGGVGEGLLIRRAKSSARCLSLSFWQYCGKNCWP